MAPSKASPKKGKGKAKVHFGANGASRKRKSSAADSDTEPSSTKRARKDGASESTSAGGSASTGTTNAGGSGSANASGSTTGGATGADTNNTATGTTAVKKRARNRWGILPSEVPIEAKMTQARPSFILFHVPAANQNCRGRSNDSLGESAVYSPRQMCFPLLSRPENTMTNASMMSKTTTSRCEALSTSRGLL